MLRIAAVVLPLPFGHLGVMGRLAIDGPGIAVVVRRRYPRFVVDMGEHLKTELRVFVKDMQAARRLFATPAHKVGVR